MADRGGYDDYDNKRRRRFFTTLPSPSPFAVARYGAICSCIVTTGRRLNGFLGLSLNDRTILFLVILFHKTVSVGYDARLTPVSQSRQC